MTRVDVPAYTVDRSGVLSFSIADLETDLAVKFIRGTALDFVSFHKDVSPGYADSGARATYSIVVRSVAGPLTNTLLQLSNQTTTTLTNLSDQPGQTAAPPAQPESSPIKVEITPQPKPDTPAPEAPNP